MKTIEERARLAAWQIFEEIGLSQHSVDRVAEIIAEKMHEEKAIDIDKACEWLKEQVYQEYGGGPLERLIPDTMIEKFRNAMEE